MRKYIYAMVVFLLVLLSSAATAFSLNLDSERKNIENLGKIDYPRNQVLSFYHSDYFNSDLLSDERLSFVLGLLDDLLDDNIVDSSEIDRLVSVLQEEFKDNSIYVNTLCKVTGIGEGLLLPPFIPVTPLLLVVGGVILDTNGAMGQWCHLLHIAIFIPFVGIPLYILPPPLFIIGGFTGFVLGIVFD